MNTRMLTTVVLVALGGAGVSTAQPTSSPIGPSLPLASEPRLPETAAMPRVVCADPINQFVPKCWMDIDYLLYWISPSRYPQPLATTSSPASLGVLGQADTSVLIGGDVNFETHNGVRLYAGTWLNSESTIGADGELIFLE